MEHTFLRGLSGRVVTPGDASYNEDRQGWNRGLRQYPLVINYCRTDGDVSNAVLWARRTGVPVRVRSGGHNYEGYSGGDGVLVIDVSGMNAMELDEQSQTLRVQGGVTNRALYEYAAARGYPFPGGTCPTVGVCGYALGGGWGLSCRYFGLGCDSMEEIELVNDEGCVIKANASSNVDLFWACRGAGGGNFGVVTAMTLRLPPRIQYVTLIEIDYECGDAQAQARFLQAWQEWLCGADHRMTLLSRIYNSREDGPSMLVRGIFYGEPEAAALLLQGFLSFGGAVSQLQYVPFLEAVTILGGAYPAFEKFRSASRFVYKYFSPPEISRVAGLIRERPAGSVYAGLSMYALGGRVSRTGVNDTAFFHRNAHYIIWLETVWEDNRFAPDNSQWIDRQFPCLASLTAGSYVNFPYGGLCCYREAYYGAHAPCLEQIKARYDPFNVFSFPQGLGEGRSCGKEELSGARAPVLWPPEEASAKGAGGGANHRGFRYVERKEL